MQVSDIKFRASRIGDLMSKSTTKGEAFGQVAKSYMTEIYIGKKYGRYKDIYSKYMEKGIEAEEDSITLLSKIDRWLYVKNEENLSNEFITGTPDIIIADFVDDVKTSWDIFTFFASKRDKLNKRYECQLQCYMWLTGKSRARLRYCLTNTPESIINDELRKLSYQIPVESAEFSRAEEKLRREMEFDDIPLSERVVTHIIDRDEKTINDIQERVILAREWIAENLLT